MKLQPAVTALVKELIEQGRAGQKPFGIPLATWKAEIKKQEETTCRANGEAASLSRHSPGTHEGIA